MTVIEASSVRAQTMADDTLRLTVDIEPRFADAAFQLFGKRGVPMALAALVVATHKTQSVSDNAPSGAQVSDKPKGGMWAQWAALRCQDAAFQVWLSETYVQEWAAAWQGNRPSKANAAADVIRRLCGIESRAALDNDEAAKARFDRLLRGPWQKHYQAVNA